jgi:N-terminal domain of 16S rRNA methyltransferase RsmF
VDKTQSNAESVHWCKNGYNPGTRPSFALDPLFHSGFYYPQEDLVFSAPKNLLWPIPQKEIDVNPNIGQGDQNQVING